MPEITTPVGRIVYGHPLKLVQKRNTKKELVFKDGKPVMIRSFGVAFSKADFNTYLWPVMWTAAAALYGGQNPPQHFAYKMKDGDTNDRQGVPYANREGYAGCIVVHFETQLDVNGFRPNGAAWQQIAENEIKTGDYVAVNVSIEGNKPVDTTFTPSLYVNPQGVLLIGVGQAILNTPSAEAMFGGHNFALPPGATAPGAAPAMPQGMAGAPGSAPPSYGTPPAQQQYQPAPQQQQYQPAPQQQQYQPAPQQQYQPAPQQQQYQPAPQQQYQPAPQQQYQPAPQQQQYQPAPQQQQYQPAPDFVQAATGQAPSYQQPPAGGPGQMPPGFPPR